MDRPPNFNIYMTFAARRIGAPLSRYYTDFRVLADANRRMVEEFEADLYQAISDPYREACDLGAEVEFPDRSLPMPVRPLLDGPGRRPAVVEPWDGRRMTDRLEAVRLMRERSGGRIPVMGWVEGALALAAVLRGVPGLLLDLVDAPDDVRGLLEFCCEHETRFALAQVDAGAHLVGLGDAVASQVGPAMYRAFALPYERRIFEAVRARGALTRLHICGDTGRILPDMVHAGADIIDLDWMVDWARAHREFGGTAFCGNVDPVAVMLQASPDGVREAVRECLVRGGGRSFSAAGCEIPPDTPAQNLLAHAAELRAWGRSG